MEALAASVLSGILATWETAAIGLSVLTVVELIAPCGTPQPLAGRLQGLVFVVIWIATAATLVVAFHATWATLGWRPWSVNLSALGGWAGPLAPVVGGVFAAMFADLTFYWYHRLQHAAPWLWRLHAVHHSIRDMNAVNSYHHLSEAAVRLALTVLPLSWLDIHAQGAALIGALFSLQVTAIHSPTKLHAGPLRWLLADNRFHRIHHSLEPVHFDKNFAANFSFWDALFGTAHFPAADEWPDVGLADVPEPSSLREWLDLPFRLRPQTAAPEAVEPA